MSVRIKICGITNPADAELAAALGADMVGVNFYAKSPRYVDESAARAIVAAIPSTVETVGVFANEPWLQARRVAATCGIGTIQMHGDLGECLVQGVRSIPAFA